jgi:hypothetical protein
VGCDEESRLSAHRVRRQIDRPGAIGHICPVNVINRKCKGCTLPRAGANVRAWDRRTIEDDLPLIEFYFDEVIAALERQRTKSARKVSRRDLILTYMRTRD